MDGYSFLGWFTSQEGGEKITSTSTFSTDTNQTLYAHWGIGNMMMARTDGQNIWNHSSKITQIVFENTKSPKANVAYTYDISTAQNEEVTAQLVPTESDSTKYIAYIQADGVIYANTNCANLFNSFFYLKSIEGMENFDTSYVTNMYNMFNGCANLMALDLSHFDTSKVTTTSYMFKGCTYLMALDLSRFDTSEVTDMSYMFANCERLATLDVSSFDTSNVINMGDMFYYCKGLTTLDLSNFDTSKVTFMSWMFNNCTGLTMLDLSNFDTSKVTMMDYMFGLCTGLTTLDLSNFNTSSLIYMDGMFGNCTGLTTLNVSSFDTSKVTSMMGTFGGLESLTTLDLSNFNTSKLIDTTSMFQDSINLSTTITIRNAIWSSDCRGMFENAATSSGALITVNYTSNASTTVTNMISTKSSNSNVVKGIQVD